MNPIPIHACNPGPFTGAGNWTWLIPGRVPTLIDAGTGEPAFLDALERALDGATLVQVLVTHGHSDHASGIAALITRMPNVRLRKMPWPERDARWPAVWEPLADGDVIDAGDSAVMAIHTPGHAPDHLCFLHEPTRTLFGADLALKDSTVFIPASQGGDLAAYLASIDRVIALNPARILPAHGEVMDEPLKVLRGYLDHRRDREAQVVTALGEGPADLDELVTRIYSRLAPALLPLARESLLAHLVKLEREGRARHASNTWNMIGP